MINTLEEMSLLDCNRFNIGLNTGDYYISFTSIKNGAVYWIPTDYKLGESIVDRFKVYKNETYINIAKEDLNNLIIEARNSKLKKIHSYDNYIRTNI